MTTTPIYLENSYQKELDTIVSSISKDQNGDTIIFLKETIFYPIGGGQATDQGKVISSKGEFEVYNVMIRNDEINHYIKGACSLEIGDEVKCILDWDRRYKNMKIHSAGHVLDFAMYLIGLSPKTLIPTKGNHDKKPYVLYSGVVDGDFKLNLQDKINELLISNKSFTTKFMSLEELEKNAIYLQPGLPTNKPLRSLTLEGVGTVADGGTQVANVSEIGQITIGDIKIEDGNTVVYYQVS